jgi:hypothetical protein
VRLMLAFSIVFCINLLAGEITDHDLEMTSSSLLANFEKLTIMIKSVLEAKEPQVPILEYEIADGKLIAINKIDAKDIADAQNAVAKFRKLKQECITLAGRYKINQLADNLLNDISFTLDDNKIRPPKKSISYPAVGALIQIGQPVTIQALRRLSSKEQFLDNSEIQEGARSEWTRIYVRDAENLLDVLVGIEGTQVAAFLLQHPPDGNANDLKFAFDLAKERFPKLKEFLNQYK